MAKTKTRKIKRRSKSTGSSKAAKRSSASRRRRTKAAGKGKRASPARSRKPKSAPAKARRPASRRKVAGKSRRLVAKPAAGKPKRLPPRKRHTVESDESRERVGDAEGEAFVGADTTEDEAKELGEEFVRSVTSGEEAESEMEEDEAVEEQGGPFVVTSASTEYGFGTDASNPVDAEKAPFPQVSPAVSPGADAEDEDQ